MRRPDPATYESMIAWLESELDRNATPYTPPPGLHRLNRTEYANSIRDLLDLPIDPAKYLPSDDSTSGFDNIAGALGISSTLVEAYVTAAQKISRLALGEPEEPTLVVYRAPRGHDAGLSHRRAAVRHARRPAGRAPVSLRRRIHDHDHADLRRQHDAHRLWIGALRADRSPAGRRSAGADGLERRRTRASDRLSRRACRPHHERATGWARSVLRRPRRRADARATHATAGAHKVGATFLATQYAPLLDLDRRFRRSTIQTGPTPGYTFFPHVGTIRIEGPYSAVQRDRFREPAEDLRLHAGPSGRRRRVRPANRRRISPRSAFRRPATAADVDSLMDVLSPRTPRKGLRARHRDGARARAGLAAIHLSHRRGAGERGRGPDVSHQRHRFGFAPLVLPVEQPARRRAAEGRGAGTSQGSGRPRTAGAPDARASEGESAVGELRGPVAEPARPRQRRARARCSIPTSTIRSVRRCAPRSRCCSTASSARIVRSPSC